MNSHFCCKCGHLNPENGLLFMPPSKKATFLDMPCWYVGMMRVCTSRPCSSADKCRYGSGMKRVKLVQHVCWHLIGSVYCLCQAHWTVALTEPPLFPVSEAIISLLYKRSGMYTWGSEVISPISCAPLSITNTLFITEIAERKPCHVKSEPFWNKSLEANVSWNS